MVERRSRLRREPSALAIEFVAMSFSLLVTSYKIMINAAANIDRLLIKLNGKICQALIGHIRQHSRIGLVV